MFIKMLENPKALELMYDHLDLKNIEIKDIILSREGPEAIITIKLSQFPDRPPKKWDSYYNTANLVFKIAEMSKIDIKMWGRENNCDINLSPSGSSSFSLIMKGSDVDVCITGKFLTFVQIVGYKSTGSPSHT